jgi:predicted alpha/beta superfamily hydrolase
MTDPMSERLKLIAFNWPSILQLSGSKPRRVWVWLPDDYYRSNRTYSVLFMHDGQNVFRDSDANYGTCWSMIEAQRSLKEPLIVVAVEGQDNSLQRFNELSPWQNPELHLWKGNELPVAGGLADAYLKFLVESIVTEVHRRFRCKTAPEFNILGGSSMGGFVSLYAATRYEHVFSSYMAMSTATWFFQDKLFEALQNHEFQVTTKVYADVGTNETSNPEIPNFPSVYVEGNRYLFKLLVLKLTTAKFRSCVAEGEAHNEAAWAKRLPDALNWLAVN